MTGRLKRLRGVDRESGFTLIELMVAVIVMGIITVPLGNFMLEYLQNTTTTTDRFSDSHDIQLASAYFAQDVAATGLHSAVSPYPLVQSVWTTSPPAAPYCGQAVGTVKLLLSWDSWTVTGSGNSATGADTPASVAYAVSGSTLHRVYCATGSITSSDVTVVHGLRAVTVSCSSTCNAGAPNAGTPPATVSLSLQIATGTTDQAAPSAPIVLTGQRRQS